MEKRIRKSTVKVNNKRINELVKNEGLSYSDLSKSINKTMSKSIGDRTLRRMATQEGVKVSKDYVTWLAQYYSVNFKELIIPENDEVKSNNRLALQNIGNFRDFQRIQGFEISRKLESNGSGNVRTYRYYNLTFNEEISTLVKLVIKFSFSEVASKNIYKNDKDSIEQEFESITNRQKCDEAIERLNQLGIFIYYGQYDYRCIKEQNFKLEDAGFDLKYTADTIEELKKNGTDIKEAEKFISTLVPDSVKIEIIIFQQYKQGEWLPDYISFSPETGYTQKELHDKYIKHLEDYRNDKKISSITSEWIKYAENENWSIKENAVSWSDKIYKPNTYLSPIHYIPNSIETASLFKYQLESLSKPHGSLISEYDKDLINVLSWIEEYDGFGFRTIDNPYKKKKEDEHEVTSS